MTDPRRVRDVARIGTISDVAQRLNQIEQTYRNSCAWIRDNVERTEESLTLHNLIGAALPYLHSARIGLEGPIQVIALATRSLFELNLIVRHVMQSQDNLKLWTAEAVSDKIELLEGILELREPDSSAEAAKILENEIARLKQLCTKHQIPSDKKPDRVYALAKASGLEREYRALYKLFSKLVHPSSYSVNTKPEDVYSQEHLNTLVLHLQMYSIDMLERIGQRLSIPKVTSQPGPQA